MNDPHILLVEDDDDHAELMLRALDDHGWADDVTHVKDGAQALAYLFGDPHSDPGRVPDLVFLDLRLPRVDGIEVLRKVKAAPQLQHLPIVVMTTSEAPNDMERAYAAHVNAYVVKPVDSDQLDKMIGDASSFWLRWNRRLSG